MPWISKKNHQSYIEKNATKKNIGKITPLTAKKKELSKYFKSLQFLMVQVSLNPNIYF